MVVVCVVVMESVESVVDPTNFESRGDGVGGGGGGGGGGVGGGGGGGGVGGLEFLKICFFSFLKTCVLKHEVNDPTCVMNVLVHVLGA